MPDLPNLENQGWEQMKMLLDRHLPQGSTPAPVASYTPSIIWPIAALWLAVLFCTPVLVADHKPSVSPIREIVATTTHTADSLAISFTNGPIAAPLSPATEAITTANGSTAPENGNTSRHYHQQVDGRQAYGRQGTSPGISRQPNENQIITNNAFLEAFNTHISPVQQSVSADAANVSVLSGITASSDSANIHSLDQVLPAQQRLVANPAPIVPPAKPVRMPNKWALAVQVNRNLNSNTPSTESKLYNLPVYPSFTASYYLNKQISISTGLAALAPGHLNKRISSRTDNVIISGSPLTPPPTAYAVTNKEEIKQTYYFQVPLTVDVHLKKHFTLSAGVALAFLHKALLQTDNNLNNLRDSSMTLTTFRELLAPASIEAKTEVGKLYEIRKFDPRFLLGVSYQWHRFQLGVQYARAIRSSVVSKYQPELNNHTELVNLHVGFQLFGPK